MDIAALITAITGLTLALAGIVTAIYTGRNAARKTDIETLHATIALMRVELTTAHNDNRELRKENDELRAAAAKENKKLHDRVHELEGCIETMEDEIKELSEQIIALGGKPKTGPLKRAA